MKKQNEFIKSITPEVTTSFQAPILPESLAFGITKIDRLTATIDTYNENGDHITADGGEHANKQMAILRLIDHPIVTEQGCRFCENEILENSGEGVFDLTIDSATTTDSVLYALRLVETPQGIFQALYAATIEGKTVFGVFETKYSEERGAHYISSPARFID